MSSLENEIKILGETIKLTNDYLSINELKFMKDNPRVYSCIYDELDFKSLTEDEQQEIIFRELKQEQSVKNLVPEIKRHGGLMEHILVRHDTKEVIEGNSRLAAYRKLYEETKEETWEIIPCDIVSSLTDEQRVAFLNQIHVKGKTKWSAYEKANLTYMRKKDGWSYEKLANLFGESQGTLQTRVRVIEMMKESNDSARSHFSYYDVMVRRKEIYEHVNSNNELRNLLFEQIRGLGNIEKDENLDFTAQDLRKKLPAVLDKPKVLKKYIQGDVDLDTAYQRAKISDAREKIRKATDILADVERKEILTLEKNELNSLKQDYKKLTRQTVRIDKVLEKGAS